MYMSVVLINILVSQLGPQTKIPDSAPEYFVKYVRHACARVN